MRVQPQTMRAGQAVLESAFVIIAACLIFFGLLQLSRLYAGQAVVTYAAVAGARARMVGFNDFMVHKVVRAASIPNAGRMTTPESPADPRMAAWMQGRPGEVWDHAVRTRTPLPAGHGIESSLIPLYLASENHGHAEETLHYEHWPTVRHRILEGSGILLRMQVEQNFPLTLPFRGAFYADDHLRLRGGSEGGGYAITRELHYPVYLQ